jgi:CRISPR/Cas system-associated exonuclease Cas4 (RecB family)
MKTMIDRPHWSYSAISQYLRCPLQFYFERVLGLPRRTASGAQVLGSAIHSVLAAYHHSLKAGEALGNDQVQQALVVAWHERLECQAVINDRPADDALDLGMQLLATYLGEPAPRQVVAVEEPLLEKPLLAIPDLILRDDDGQTRIREIKTTSRSYSESEVASSLQPTCYASALFELTGEEPAIELVALVKTRTPKLQKIEAIRNQSDFRRLGDVIEAVQRGVDSGVFYPVESPLNCSSCSYHRECRGWSGTRNFGSDDSGDSSRLHREEAALAR